MDLMSDVVVDLHQAAKVYNPRIQPYDCIYIYCVCVCACARVHACVCACMRACVCVCVCGHSRCCLFVCLCLSFSLLIGWELTTLHWFSRSLMGW